MLLVVALLHEARHCSQHFWAAEPSAGRWPIPLVPCKSQREYVQTQAVASKVQLSSQRAKVISGHVKQHVGTAACLFFCT